VKQRWQEQ